MPAKEQLQQAQETIKILLEKQTINSRRFNEYNEALEAVTLAIEELQNLNNQLDKENCELKQVIKALTRQSDSPIH